MPNDDVAASFGMSPRKWEIACSIAGAFARRGYHGVGMRELAADLGLNQGTLYHHFPSKDDALLAICLVGQSEVRRYSTMVLQQYASFPQRVRTLLAAHLTSLGRFGDFIDVYASQWMLLAPELALPLREEWRLQRRDFELLFEDAVARKEVAADIPVRDALRLLLGIFRTVNILHRTGRSSELEGFAAFAVNTLVTGMVNPVSAGR